MPSRRKLRDLLSQKIPFEIEGALAPKESLTRLTAARDEVTKQSNNFLLVSIGFAILYCLRSIGLRLDITVLDYKIFETPYGLFVFCVCSSISFVVAMSRFMDARIFDRYAKATCEIYWPNQADYAYNTFPRINSWLEPTNRALSDLRKSKSIGFFVSLVTGIAGLSLFLFYSASIMISLHFLVNFEQLSNDFGKDFQFWSVFAMIVIDIAFLISTFSVMEIDVD